MCKCEKVASLRHKLENTEKRIAEIAQTYHGLLMSDTQLDVLYDRETQLLASIDVEVAHQCACKEGGERCR